MVTGWLDGPTCGDISEEMFFWNMCCCEETRDVVSSLRRCLAGMGVVLVGRSLSSLVIKVYVRNYL